MSKEASLLSLELQFATKLSSAVEFYIVDKGNLPTNIDQIIPFMTIEGWALWEERFKQFGEQSGFTNSIFEKYIFMPPGTTFSIGPTEAEAVMVNAQPFVDNKGGQNRWVIYRTGEIVGSALLKEADAQEIKRSGIEIHNGLPKVSAIEMDAPRRREAAETQREMEEEMKQFIAEQDRSQTAPRSIDVQGPARARPQRPNVGTRDAMPESRPPNSRNGVLGIVLVTIVGVLIAAFAFRCAGSTKTK